MWVSGGKKSLFLQECREIIKGWESGYGVTAKVLSRGDNYLIGEMERTRLIQKFYFHNFVVKNGSNNKNLKMMPQIPSIGKWMDFGAFY